MKRFLLLSLFTFLCVYTSLAQEQQVKVILRSGASLVGELKNIDGVNSLTIVVGGIESEIPMAEVSAIEPIVETKRQQTINSDPLAALSSGFYGQYVITDDKDYPESFVIKVGNQEITMVLVRGGVFNMGYDGDGSVFMDTEPMHKVMVSSYYVGVECINNTTAYTLVDKKYSGNFPDNIFRTRDWSWAANIAAIIAEQEEAPYRLLTEAEWEYAAILPIADVVFSEIVSTSFYKNGGRIGEWCNDYWAKYSDGNQINPQGPSTGKKHVARCYATNKYRWCRDLKKLNKNATQDKYITRIAISAEQIIDKIR